MSKPMGPRGIVLFTFAVGIGLYLAWLLRDVLVVIYVSALFAVVLMPLVRGIMRLHIRQWHPGRGVAVLLMLVLTVGVIGGVLFFGLRPAFYDLRDFIRRLPEEGPQFFARIQEVPVLRDMNLDALQEKIQDFVGHFAMHAAEVFAFQPAARMHQCVGELAIGGEQQ